MIKFLRFLNLIDRRDRLSLSNVAVYICLVKIALTTAGVSELTALMVAMLNYAYKRKVESNDSTQ